nr:unnamed protein product [Spirometra erinaceieuropaei]
MCENRIRNRPGLTSLQPGGQSREKRLQDSINDFVFYGRYVDDIVCLADDTTDTKELVQKFNTAHPSLKFTTEAEADNEIAFLDVLLRRQEDGSIQRRVFRKKTWTGHYVNFHNFVPLNIKWNLVQGLAAKVRRICSPEAIEEELQQLRNTLRENGYPNRFILRNIGERAAKPTAATAEKKECTAMLLNHLEMFTNNARVRAHSEEVCQIIGHCPQTAVLRRDGQGFGN